MDLFAQLRHQHFVIAGPCVLESLELALETAQEIARMSRALGLPAIFKSSFDKANRSAYASFRGPGMRTGISWLAQVKDATGLPILTDIHDPSQAAPVAEVADVLQIPAFLCRQTDLLQAAARTGRIVNIKKGQFLAPWDMAQVTAKVQAAGGNKIWLTERGTTFGYNNLVVDFRSLPLLATLGYPVIFDATHSAQLPGAAGCASGGERHYVPYLARAAAACGCHGLFVETHPNPDHALCDGPNSWPLNALEDLLRHVQAIWNIPHADASPL
jgi:2-dehydro-3-deoxyphosphooctonate aldolase (KDO 8-P synthase)